MKDPQFDSFQVMNFIFGGQAFGSRLFDRIREKESLAYVVSTQMDLTSRPGALYVYLGTRPRNVKAAVDAVRQEISRIRTDGVTDDEMDLTKNFLRSLMPFRMQTYSEIAAGLLNLRFYDLPADYYDTYGARIDKVTRQEVLDAATTYLTPDNSCLVVVGPVDQNLGAVSPVLKRSSEEHGRTGRH
jgi:zinc protease